MYAALKALDELLNEKKVRHAAVQDENRQVIIIPFEGKQQRVNVQCIATSDLADVALRVPQYMHIPIEKRRQALEEINRMNRDYRYICLALDDDNDVLVQSDIPQSAEPAAEVIWNAFVMMTRVLEQCYPRFMKLIWGD